MCHGDELKRLQAKEWEGVLSQVPKKSKRKGSRTDLKAAFVSP